MADRQPFPREADPLPAEIRDLVQERVGLVDASACDAVPDDHGPRGWIAALAAAGLFARDADPDSPDLRASGRVIEELASICLSTGFSAWAHRMTIDYLREASPSSPLGELRGELIAGRRVGATAMAVALQYLSGLTEIPVQAHPDPDGGYRLSGPIRWASNLVEDAVVVLPAVDVSTQEQIVVAVTVDSPGFNRAPIRPLLALNATYSTSFELDDLAVADSAVISRDLRAFARRARPAMLLLQTSFCLGLAGRCLAETKKGLASGRGTLDAPYAELADRHAELARATDEWRADPAQADPVSCTRARLDAAELVRGASHLEFAATGGRAYGATAGASRRAREAAFLPVQSPTEVHLRWDLDRLVPAAAG